MIAFLLLAALQPGDESTKGGSARAPSLLNPQSPVRYDDYPTQSLRNSEAGIVSVLLHISPQGRALSCDVTETSGFSLLDVKTCLVLKARSRFAPATDTEGMPIAGLYQTAVAWGVGDNQPRVSATIPLYVSALPASYKNPVETKLFLDKSGRVAQCLIETSSGSAPVDRAACAHLRENLSIAPPKSKSASVEPIAIRHITATFVVK